VPCTCRFNSDTRHILTKSLNFSLCELYPILFTCSQEESINKIFLVLKPVSRIAEKYISRSEEMSNRPMYLWNIIYISANFILFLRKDGRLMRSSFFLCPQIFKLTIWLSWNLVWTLCHWKPLQCFIFHFLQSVTRTW
jgi:hypothetical protein